MTAVSVLFNLQSILHLQFLNAFLSIYQKIKIVHTAFLYCTGFRVSNSTIFGERSEPLSRVFKDQPRDMYGDVGTYVRF